MQRKQIADIQDQVEFYFSVENLPFDKFLQNEISKDADGWVPILTLLKFPKLASFTMDTKTVALALTYSKTLMLSEDRQSVRLKRDMHITQNVDQRRIYVVCILDIIQDFPISTSKEEIKVFFEQFGKIKSILLLKDLYSRCFNGCVRVTFETNIDAVRFTSSKILPTFTSANNMFGTKCTVQLNLKPNKYVKKMALKEQNIQANRELFHQADVTLENISFTQESFGKIFVDNLHPSATEEIIFNEFKKFFPQEIKLINQRPDSNSMIAEIILPNVEIAQQSSLEMNDKTILEQSIHVYFDGPIFQIRNNSLFVENNRALFLSHIPNNVSVQELKDVFTYPKPERIVRVFDRQQEKFMDFASVIFPSTADREMILETIGREIILKGKNIQMRRFGKKLQDEEDKGKSEQRSQKDEQMTSLDSQKLIIINIPQEISTSQIEQVFMKFGEVKFTIPLNIRTGHQFQFGFAQFKTTEQAGAALNSLNGKDIFRVGYGLQISFAEPVTDANSKLTVLNLPPNITKHHRAVIVLNDYNKVKNVIRDQNNMIIDGCIINIQKVLTQEEKLYRKSDFWKLINRKDVNIRGLEQQVYELQEKAHEMQVYSQKSHELVQKIEIDKQIEYAGNNACELFVNGISSLHSNEDLLQQFKQFGAVKAYVQKEKGFGFVTFLSVRNAQTAINAMNGRIIGGRKIKVNFGNKAPQFNKDRDMKTALENEHLNEEAARNAEAEVNDAIHELQNLKQRLMIRETSKDKLSIFVNNNEISDSEEEEEEEEEGSCMICNDDLSEGNICSCNCERHHFIHCECLKASLESDLNQFQLNIRCIADPDCIAEYSMELLEQLLDEGKYSLLQELLIINYGGSEADERSILQEKMPEQEKIEKENEVDQQKREDHEFEKAIAAALTNALIRYCPQCGRGIIQEQGLSIIQCVCQKFFCQNCQKDISEIKFKHFQEEKCKLNIPANSIDRQQRQIKKAQEAAEKFVKEHPQFDNCDQKMKKCLDLWI